LVQSKGGSSWIVFGKGGEGSFLFEQNVSGCRCCSPSDQHLVAAGSVRYVRARDGMLLTRAWKVSKLSLTCHRAIVSGIPRSTNERRGNPDSQGVRTVCGFFAKSAKLSSVIVMVIVTSSSACSTSLPLNVSCTASSHKASEPISHRWQGRGV
jgi:hypothetical protein